jgi:hypothetical protein
MLSRIWFVSVPLAIIAVYMHSPAIVHKLAHLGIPGHSAARTLALVESGGGWTALWSGVSAVFSMGKHGPSHGW